jgi:pSer/pThr/pTyr-binding forkhead associated (FHA) protein
MARILRIVLEGHELVFDGSGPIIIGRDPEVDVHLDNPYVSGAIVDWYRETSIGCMRVSPAVTEVSLRRTG